jgi:hypothetical protein
VQEASVERVREMRERLQALKAHHEAFFKSLAAEKLGAA